MTYTPPTNRKEAVDEIMRSGFTISAMLAVALAFPLPGEIEETATSNAGKLMLEHYGGEACTYLVAWNRNYSQVKSDPR